MAESTYCQFRVARLRPTWRRLTGPERSELLAGLEALVSRYPEVRVDPYLPGDGDPGCDFMLRLESSDPRALEEMGAWMAAAAFFQHVEPVLTARGRTLTPRYVTPEQVEALLRREPAPDLGRHAFLFRISRTRDWWHLPDQERRAMVREHVDRGLAAGEPIYRCCYYCAGLDDQQDFLYYLESYSEAAVLEAYAAAQALRDARYWARHDLVFQGRLVTLAKWKDRVRLGIAHRPGAQPAAAEPGEAGPLPQHLGAPPGEMPPPPGAHP
ncbi:MAG: chlorite dismutase family protein [Bacillota bacterium]